MSTKEKLVSRALELFNENGIEYVGMRELAADLKMRVGNVTYYFATKDDLVIEIINRLRDLNSKTIEADCSSITSFLSMYRQLFNNQYQYRCLLLSFVHLVSRHPSFAGNYAATDARRREALRSHITSMIKNNCLSTSLIADHVELVVSHITLISRFWISEARISYANWTLEQTIAHYLNLLGEVLFPYATVEGKKQVDDFRKGK
ncbi:TetR/AcrR family transcriptional regulator [Flavitalea sp. BT771]|uniref:TetR/AcrR family transcriptional regulator n=1 Tax=Flavitalea sp. BT771 TaxID=3063329 RepID=UPI0026E2609E|nr:TetR/AcrR family transcriptional regulator [Flavitalea sp. BT771]MDO6429630.1 TetR/AcrR family transcriptional regulator [Flavitalea sp. BT771]MDV6218242.1 TetR/AcrR family transcriptional regulator [Flavitalea sp. BT771]